MGCAVRRTEKFWDRLAKRYAKTPIKNVEAYQQTIDQAKAYLGADDTVLEVGCGTGSTALLLAGAVKQITATDISSNMIAIGKEKAEIQGVSNVRFLKGTLADEIPLSGQYDAVLAFNILHLLEDLPHSIQLIKEQVRPGGLVISKTVCMAGASGFWRFLLPIMQVLRIAPYVSFLSVEELEGYFQAGGFEIVEATTYPASPPSRFIIARSL